MNFYTELSGRLQGNLYKFLLVMRLTLILLIAGIMQVSATTYGQQITLDQKNISIKQIFKAIKSQTGYDVLWQPAQLDAAQKINVHFNNTSLADVIKECISGSGLIYEIQDQSIVLKPASLLKNVAVQQDSVIFRGKVTDEDGKPMAGVTVKVSGGRRTTFTTAQGNFSIYAPVKGTLEFTYIGYLGKQLTLSGLEPSKPIMIKMALGNNNLGEVSIISNGYQDLPKERATGSFEVITKEQLQHSTDPNLIKRLEGITTSMNFNNNLAYTNSAAISLAPTNPNASPINRLTIRGRNTLNPINTQGGGAVGIGNLSGQVLVVIDGVPSPYSIDNVNPNDVESLTILKDAAAASVWGARAANGVIVVKTKRSGYEKPVGVSFNSNFAITEKPNLFYRPIMSTSEYINAQIFQFNAAGTNVLIPSLTRLDPFYSPVVEILGRQQRGEISVSEMNSQLDALRGNDIRNDITKYILRDAATQSYSLAIDGGSKKVAYRMSGGYDKTLNNTISSDQDRLVLNYTTSYKPIKNLELNANISYSRRTSDDQSTSNPVRGLTVGSGGYYPYTRLADDQGNPLSIPYKYRPAFIDLLSNTYGNKIQDLHFTPLNDINQGYFKTNLKSLNFNVGGNYVITDFLSANIVYNYNNTNYQSDYLDRQNSFYIRDVVTFFTTTSGIQQFPQGARYYGNVTNSSYNSFRGQLNFNKTWSDKHILNAIAGIETTNSYSLNKPFHYLGYNEDLLSFRNTLDYVTAFTTLFPGVVGAPFGSSTIPYVGGVSFTDSRIRTYSLYANAAYTYNGRYTLSGSVRKDESNLFGVGTNNHGTPYYSLGSSWNIANEEFYRLNWLPRLQLRATFGYNGNVNPLVQSIATTVQGSTTQNNSLPYLRASGSDVTNDLLRPEKTGILNLGLDFGLKNNRISGSFEYYRKATTDLLTGNLVDPTTGFSSLIYNTANLLGWGTDFTLNSRNLQAGLFGWSSTFLFSYNRVKIQKLYSPSAFNAGAAVGGGNNEGYDLSRIFGFKWAGLNPRTGDPQGYVNGQPFAVNNSSTYNTITTQSLSSARYFGSAVPVYSGSVRNTITYGALSLSANLLYRLGYYFRRPLSDIVGYTQLFVSGRPQGIEYASRWQGPGDEVKTNVPSQVNSTDQTRDIFYQNSEINVLKADHIRLQEINLSYYLSKKNWFLKNPRIYANVNNLGIIWRANKFGLDPDVNDLPNPRTYSFGFSANF